MSEQLSIDDYLALVRPDVERAIADMIAAERDPLSRAAMIAQRQQIIDRAMREIERVKLRQRVAAAEAGQRPQDVKVH
jgi:hypothetical protein